MSKYQKHNQQSVFDIAMHHYGDASQAIFIAIANNQSLTDIPADEVELPDAEINYYVVKSISNRKVIPATWGTGLDGIQTNILFWDGYLHPYDTLSPETQLKSLNE